MRTHPLRKGWKRALAACLTGGVCFQFGGCSLLGTLGNFIGGFNPCGVILNCDPIEYNFLTSGYRGPGVDPDIDPSCTYPPYCDPEFTQLADPFTGGPP